MIIIHQPIQYRKRQKKKVKEKDKRKRADEIQNTVSHVELNKHYSTTASNLLSAIGILLIFPVFLIFKGTKPTWEVFLHRGHGLI